MSNPVQRVVVTVDDDPASRRLLERQLQKAGYIVHSFETARGAMTAVHEMNSGIIIADWMMPDIDGIELLKFVREMEQLQAIGTIYFILLTAHSEKEKTVLGLEAGADDYLSKPYHPEELLARIRAGERILTLQEENRRRQLELARQGMELESLYRKLQTVANTDALTQIPNRHALLERFEEIWAQAQRQSHPLSCIMFDIDHFKKVNDTYGHSAGDAVLRDVAQIARQQLRRYDVCGRMGGEEFAVICPEADIAAATLVAERLRAAIESASVDADGVRIRVSASIGAAIMRSGHASPDSLLNDADAMLYRAKQAGRNQVWYMDEQGEPHASDSNATLART